MLNQQTKKQLNILVSMYLCYGAIMICRQMVTILGPAMLADESLGLTKTNLGDFAAYGTIGALFGKIVWGPLTDKIGGRLTFTIGISLTALLVIAFGFSANVIIFSVFSFLIYGLKSSGWPALTKLVGNWFHPKKYGRVWGILSTSSRASVVIGTLFFGYLLNYMSWRYVAVISAIIAILISIYGHFTMKEEPDDKSIVDTDIASKDDPELAKEAAKALENLHNHPLKETSLAQGLLAFLKSHRVWLVTIMMMLLTCLMAFLDFVSVYLMEVFELTPANASMASSLFPLGSLTGLIASTIFYDKFSKKGLRRVLSIVMVIAVLCILCLKFMPEFGLSVDANYNIALISIFFFGLSISPAYYIPMSVFSIEFGGPHSATLICLLDAFGFAASASFGFIGGRLADSASGWDGFMNMVLALSVASLLSVWAFMQAEYRASLTSK